MHVADDARVVTLIVFWDEVGNCQGPLVSDYLKLHSNILLSSFPGITS